MEYWQWQHTCMRHWSVCVSNIWLKHGITDQCQIWRNEICSHIFFLRWQSKMLWQDSEMYTSYRNICQVPIIIDILILAFWMVRGSNKDPFCPGLHGGVWKIESVALVNVTLPRFIQLEQYFNPNILCQKSSKNVSTAHGTCVCSRCGLHSFCAPPTVILKNEE